MKLLALVLGLTFGMNAFAADASSSWGEILGDYSLNADFPSFNARGVYMRVNNVCDAGQSFYSKKPVDICVAWEGMGETHRCAEYETTILEFPRQYLKDVCVEWSTEACLRYEQVVQTRKSSYVVNVYNRNFQDDYVDLAFSKPYTIDSCF